MAVFTIIASSDDSQEIFDTQVNDNSQVQTQLGAVNGQSGFFGSRYLGITDTLCQGAYLTVTPYTGKALALDVDVYAHADDNSATFPSTSAELSFWRIKTTAHVQWTTTLVLGTGSVSPDISAVVNEVMTRPGWVPGNAISIILVARSSSSGGIKTFDGGLPMTLEINPTRTPLTDNLASPGYMNPSSIGVPRLYRYADRDPTTTLVGPVPLTRPPPRPIRVQLHQPGQIRAWDAPPIDLSFPFTEIKQSHTIRGVPTRKARPIESPLVTTVPIVTPPPTDWTRPLRVRGLLGRKAKPVETVPPQFNPPFPFAEITRPLRVRGLLRRKSKPIERVPPQVNPPFPFSEIRHRWTSVPSRKAKPIQTVPPQVNPPFPFSEIRHRWTSVLRRKSKPIETVPPQFNPPYPFSEIAQSRRPRGFLQRRSKPVEAVPVQVAAIPPTFVPDGRRLRRAWLPDRRARRTENLLPQIRFVQQATQATAANPMTATFAAATTINGLIVVTMRGDHSSNAANPISCTDNAGNVYIRACQVDDGVDVTPMWYCLNALPATAITISFDSAPSQFWGMWAGEYAGVYAFDRVVTSRGVGTTNDVSIPFNTATPGLVVVSVEQNQYTTMSAGVDFTLRSQIPTFGGNGGGVEDYITRNALSAYVAHMTSSVSGNYTMGILSFRQGAPDAAYPFASIVQARRLRGLFKVRPRKSERVPDQIIFTAQPPPTDATRPLRVRGQLSRRARRSEVVPSQFNPPFPFQEVVQHRSLRSALRRGKYIIPTPDQARPADAITQPKRTRGMLPRRWRRSEVVPPQFNPPFQFDEIKPWRRLRLPVVRGHRYEFTPNQQAAAPNPPITFNPSQVRRLRGLLRRQVKKAEVVQPQVAPVVTYIPQVQRKPRLSLWKRSRKSPDIPQHAHVHVPTTIKARRSPQVLRRSVRQQVKPVPQQLNPPITFQRQRLPRRATRRVRIGVTNFIRLLLFQPPSGRVFYVGPAMSRYSTGAPESRYFVMPEVTRYVPAQGKSRYTIDRPRGRNQL